MDASLAPYHHQNQELLRLARQQEALLAPATVRLRPEDCLEAVRQLVARLKAHVAMEDAVLYPALLAASAEETLAIVHALAAELTKLKHRVHQFSHHWTSAEIIRQAPEAFIEASRDLLHDLRHRIHVEETQLFPLVDRT